MDTKIQREEIRKGIECDGDSIVFHFENGDSVQELVNRIREAAEKLGLSFSEMVNEIIRDYVMERMRLEMLDWIRKMECPNQNRQECKFSGMHNEVSQNLDTESTDGETMVSEKDDTEIALRTHYPNVPNEETELIDVCRYFLDHYPAARISPEDEEVFNIFKDWANETILLHERGNG